MSIEIANPRPGGMRYTSERTATNLIKRGIAALDADGRIWFFDQADSRRRAAELRQTLREEAHEFLKNRGGIVFWNGAESELAMRRPGEVRS